MQDCNSPADAINYILPIGDTPFGIPRKICQSERVTLKYEEMISPSVVWTAHRVAMATVPDSKALAKVKRARYMRDEYRKLTKRLDCTLTHEQFRQIKKEARKAGMPPTTFFRKAALAYIDQTYLVPRQVENPLAITVSLLRNMANNLNQIAKYTNTFQKLTLINAIQARETVLASESLIKDFIQNPPLADDGQIHVSKDREF